MFGKAFISELDHRPDSERLDEIIRIIDNLGLPFTIQAYETGTNLFLDLGNSHHRVGVSCHYDTVDKAGGANDNGSAIAVCLNLINNFPVNDMHAPAMRIFFFDEEENGLRGSAAYIREFGINNIQSLINLELVGLGDQFALWPIHPGSAIPIATAFEANCKDMEIPTKRFDKIITNTADHVSFQKAGFSNVFTLTAISEKDIETAYHYFRAQEFDVDSATLWEIMRQAPVFEPYHRSSDTAEKLSDDTLSLATKMVWETVRSMQ